MSSDKIKPVPNSWLGDTPEIQSGLKKKKFPELKYGLSNILAYKFIYIFFLF